MSSPVYTLFVGDLSIYATKEDLVKVFSTFGPIKDVRIKRDDLTGKNLSYGFIEFEEVSSALSVLKSMNGFVLCGRPMRIRWATNKSKSVKSSSNMQLSPQSDTSAIHITYTVQQANIIVTEEYLRYIFSNYGYVVDATIKKTALNGDDQPCKKGYGFIHYANSQEGIESAIKAAAAMANITIDNIHFKCCLSKLFEQRLNSMMYDTSNMTPEQIYSMNCYLYAQHQQRAMLYANAMCVQMPYIMQPAAMSYQSYYYPSPAPSVSEYQSSSSACSSVDCCPEADIENQLGAFNLPPAAVPNGTNETTPPAVSIKIGEVLVDLSMPLAKTLLDSDHDSEAYAVQATKATKTIKVHSSQSDKDSAIDQLQSELNALRLAIGSDKAATLSSSTVENTLLTEADSHYLGCADLCDY